jgi:hypothetical protein
MPGPDLLRIKEILDSTGYDERLVFQTVHVIADGDCMEGG